MTLPTPCRVAVIFGGQSSEHSISCVSAAGVLQALGAAGFDTVAIGITREGKWWRQPVDQVLKAAAESKLPEVAPTGDGVVLSPQSGAPGGLDDIADVVFPVLHGPWGEDGTIQGFLELLGMPYVGSGVLASAAAMHKSTTKALLAQAGLPVGTWVSVNLGEWQRDPDSVRAAIDGLTWPVFVKPARAGSSVGITRVSDRGDLDAAMRAAQACDPQVIVESAVMGGREIECGVLTSDEGVPIASVCAEIIVTGPHEFYDFEAKYIDTAATLVVPASLSAEQLARLQALSCQVFSVLGCAGLARVDFFVRDDHIVINEVNTMPGFTPISLFPQMWAASGVDYQDLVTRLVNDALRRGTGLN